MCVGPCVRSCSCHHQHNLPGYHMVHSVWLAACRIIVVHGFCGWCQVGHWWIGCKVKGQGQSLKAHHILEAEPMGDTHQCRHSVTSLWDRSSSTLQLYSPTLGALTFPVIFQDQPYWMQLTNPTPCPLSFPHYLQPSPSSHRSLLELWYYRIAFLIYDGWGVSKNSSPDTS